MPPLWGFVFLCLSRNYYITPTGFILIWCHLLQLCRPYGAFFYLYRSYYYNTPTGLFTHLILHFGYWENGAVRNPVGVIYTFNFALWLLGERCGSKPRRGYIIVALKQINEKAP